MHYVCGRGDLPEMMGRAINPYIICHGSVPALSRGEAGTRHVTDFRQECRKKAERSHDTIRLPTL